MGNVLFLGYVWYKKNSYKDNGSNNWKKMSY